MSTLSLRPSHHGPEVGGGVPPESSAQPLYEAITYISLQTLIQLLRRPNFPQLTRNIKITDMEDYINTSLSNSIFLKQSPKIPPYFKHNKYSNRANCFCNFREGLFFYFLSFFLFHKFYPNPSVSWQEANISILPGSCYFKQKRERHKGRNKSWGKQEISFN